ncbi:hypothetical protein D9611_014667 [Ephemerocybe angulata]|uniref:Uncharacterized protein n=1 Tax=Ephemerocybe angulata TaxID=980116 RepID=A0A8H5AQV2_9AGAR|nr:hypothetical protein D9611_014667 [Tulosesus angulatus]
MSSGTSMPGSRSRYSLDLDDIIAFPDIAHVPVFGPKDGESWYILLEVTQNMSLGRPVFQVEDKLKGNFWMVAYYTDNPREDARDVEVGSTICIRDGMPHQFLDGRMGYRIEDASSVIVLPCSMAILRTINQALRKRSDDGLLLCCVMCNKPVKRGNARRRTGRRTSRLRWLPATRRITDTLSIANDLCAFRSASLMLPGLPLTNLHHLQHIRQSERQSRRFQEHHARPCSGAGRKLTLRGFTHPQLQRMDDDLGGLTRPPCTSDGHIPH